jgi:hypothetical protein
MVLHHPVRYKAALTRRSCLCDSWPRSTKPVSSDSTTDQLTHGTISTEQPSPW